MNKIQILFIHGGSTHKSNKSYFQYLNEREVKLGEQKKWSGEYLTNKLGSKFEIIRPQMPCKDYAEYEEWKIHFEKYLKITNPKLILIGSSLGGIFLAKYLSENKINKKLIAVYLVCPPFDNTAVHEELVGGFKLKSDLSKISKNADLVRLFFSNKDNIVPIEHAEKYREKLPKASVKIYSKNGHFKIATFPEIVKFIKTDTKKPAK